MNYAIGFLLSYVKVSHCIYRINEKQQGTNFCFSFSDDLNQEKEIDLL